MSRRMFRSLSRGGVTVAAIAIAALIGVAVSPGPNRTVEAIGEALGSGGEFHAVTPVRIFDSRDPLLDGTTPKGRKPMADLGVGQPFDVQVLGTGNIPSDGNKVLAVVVNITVIAPTQIGYLRAYGAGAPEGNTSVVNFFPNSVVPNTAVLRPGTDGKISLRLVSPIAPGFSHVAVDVSGWFSTTTCDCRGDRVVSINPARVYDSELAQFGGATLGSRAQIKVPIRGATEVSAPGTPIVPNSENVVGVLVNITGVNNFPGSKPTYIAAIPEAVPVGAEPTTSTVNLLPGQFRSNMAIVPVGADGSIHLFNLQGQIRLIVDVVGYLRAGDPVETRAGRVIPLVAPFRALDTREPDHSDQPLGPAEAEDWSFQSFVEDVRIGGEAVGAQAALLGNLTTTSLQRQYSWAPVNSYMTAYPSPASGSAVPNISNITISEGDTVPNLVVLRYGTSNEGPYSVRFYNRAGYIDYLLDVYAVVLAD